MGQTLLANGVLVHEAYLQSLMIPGEPRAAEFGEGLSLAAEGWRTLPSARRKQREHGGQMQRVPLEHTVAEFEAGGIDLLALDEALTRLEEQWPEKAKLVKLKYFAGLTIPETSQAMGVSTATAERYWKFSRAWPFSLNPV